MGKKRKRELAGGEESSEGNNSLRRRVTCIYFLQKKNRTCNLPPMPGSTMCKSHSAPQQHLLETKKLISACSVGDVETIKSILMASSKPMLPVDKMVDKYGSNGFMWAAGNGHLSSCKLLLPFTDVDFQNKKGRTALHFACRSGQLQIVKYLLEEAGASPLINMVDGTSCLHWASFSGSIELLAYLIAEHNMNPHSTNNHGCNCAFWCCVSKDFDKALVMAKHLSSLEVSFTTVNDAKHGVLNKACWVGNLELVRYLVENHKVLTQATAPDDTGLTCVQKSRSANRLDIAEYVEKCLLALKQSPRDE